MESLYDRKRQTNKYDDYRPSQDYEQLNTLVIDDKEYKINLTFKSVIQILHLFSESFELDFKVKRASELLGIDTENNEQVIDEIIKYVFDVTKKTTSKKSFDLEYDYKYYFVDFLNIGRGINLNKEDLDWWEFDRILEAILLNENSNMSQVMKYRLYKKPTKNQKTAEQEEHKFYTEMKKVYSLPQEQSDIDKNLEKLWNKI